MKSWLSQLLRPRKMGALRLNGKRIGVSHREWFNGVLIGSPTTVVTCWHVLLSSEELRVAIDDRRSANLTHVIAEDPLADVAVLQCDMPVVKPQFSPHESRRLPAESPVHVIAVDRNGKCSVHEMAVDRYCDSNPSHYCQLTGASERGMSGSGVFSRRGAFVGITCAGTGSIVRCTPAYHVQHIVECKAQRVQVDVWRKEQFNGRRVHFVQAMRSLDAAIEHQVDRDKCLALLEKVTEVDPHHDYIVASVDMALSKLQANESERLSFLQRLVETYGHTWLSAFFVGESQLRLGLPNDAIQSFNASLSRKQTAAASYWKALALHAGKHAQLARLAAEEASHLYPESEDLRELVLAWSK